MKANELQIGDWVRVLPISRKVEAHNSQVGALTRNVNNTINIEGGYFPSWRGWSVSEEYIEPILLTEEILLANGFEEYREGVYQVLRYRLINDIAAILIEPKKIESRIGNKYYWFSVRYREMNAVSPRITYPFVYVHELQHALRLCGLNDLANNFKVEYLQNEKY